MVVSNPPDYLDRIRRRKYKIDRIGVLGEKLLELYEVSDRIWNCLDYSLDSFEYSSLYPTTEFFTELYERAIRWHKEYEHLTGNSGNFQKRNHDITRKLILMKEMVSEEIKLRGESEVGSID